MIEIFLKLKVEVKFCKNKNEKLKDLQDSKTYLSLNFVNICSFNLFMICFFNIFFVQ